MMITTIEWHDIEDGLPQESGYYQVSYAHILDRNRHVTVQNIATVHYSHKHQLFRVYDTDSRFDAIRKADTNVISWGEAKIKMVL